MLELLTPTNAKITDYGVLSDKDRAEGDNPGAALDITMTVGNDVLTMFDGSLRGMLFTKNANTVIPAQQDLAGVEPVSDLPDLTPIGKALGQFGWDLELTGYTLTIDQGLGGAKSNITLDDCKLSGWRITGKQGGSTVIKFRVESPNVPEKMHGKLALLKTREFPITLAAPEVDGQQSVED